MLSDMFKKEHDRWLPAVVACLLLVGGAVWASVLFPAPTAEPAPVTPAEVTAPVFVEQTLRLWEGQVARFARGEALPAQVYDVAAASLPDEVQQQLAVGIVVSSEDELLTWIENLTS